MKNFKGTQGKWSIDKRANLRIVSDKDITVASASAGQCGDNLEEELANATLIANAPELLKALQMVTTQFKDLQNSLFGQNISVVGWHLNGDHQSFDSFIEDNDEGGLEIAEEVLSKILK